MKNLNKCLKITEDLNGRIEILEGLSEWSYFRVETEGGIYCSITFMGWNLWDTEDNDINKSSETILIEVIEELKDKVRFIQALITSTTEPQEKDTQ